MKMHTSLWMRKVYGDPISLNEFVSSFKAIVPRWFLCGGTQIVLEDQDTGCCSVVVFSESDFLGDTVFTSGVTISDELVYDEIQEATKTAAIIAVGLAIHPSNYEAVGELWLKRHPECRLCESDDLAIIEAALAERTVSMSDEGCEDCN